MALLSVCPWEVVVGMAVVGAAAVGALEAGDGEGSKWCRLRSRSLWSAEFSEGVCCDRSFNEGVCCDRSFNEGFRDVGGV